MSNTKRLTPEVIIARLRALANEEGFVTYNDLKRPGGGGLRAAAVREFGSWREACTAAGVKARPRGRPKKVVA
jgi:hypothetical protein